MTSLMPYIGGKHRMAREIVTRLHAPGVDTLVDVFGGSAAVTLNAGFRKRIYNDVDDNVVNVFRVIGDPQKCALLKQCLMMMPPSRTIFNACDYPPRGTDIERAAKTLYRSLFCFGGKAKDGGFSISIADRLQVKEVSRYHGVIERLEWFCEFFHNTVIECLDYQECIRVHGRKDQAVLFCDPPYVGTEHYYHAGNFSAWDHWNLAQMLNDVAARVVVTYYDDPKLRELYPAPKWTWEPIACLANCQQRNARKPKVVEWIISKPGATV
jgi:DNA adenine methylase